ncbi:hypothetical protein BFW01_g8429 [Lasiodiplodia theobromae]|uniref:Pt repeat family protein n=1 Tax=Lasiodiplodia theobromae TaxID=45133 RepID=UPI0015C343B2|nr:Pt repeat family protein [Lasiodiplodia theobromae]KAF4538778.1 Pt repeat family protein [Lasiodiplodia theobromae]KAF9637533.1 hypothetical protein BFW01_g8429 [Lasiodiplodia theobromae]
MPLRKQPPKHRRPYLKPAASEADLRGTNRPPQTIRHVASKSSFRLHRPSYYLLRQTTLLDEMDLSRPKVSVTITFSVPGTHPPVYVASSLTNPPWAPVEMSIKDERTPAGDLVFEKSFDAVESGEYQYKFRLGPGDWWVCDENAPIVSDEAGNRNNLLVVTPPQSPALDRGETSSARSILSTPEVENLATTDEPKDGEGSGSPLDTAPDPLPSTVVDQVPNAEQPAYSDKKPASLMEEASKSTAEAEPAVESEPAEANSSHTKLDSQKPVLLPSVVIEKTDDKPAYGDDLGANATQGQQEAHAKRAADAEPDKVVVTGDVEEPKELSKLRLVPKSEIPAEISNAEDQHSPLLPHEAFEPLADEAPLLPHERSTSVSNTESEDDEDAVASTDFAPVEFDGDIPLFRHESISLASSDSPPRSPSQSRPKSHASLKDMMDEEDVNDPSIEPFPTRRETIYEHLQGLANRMEVDCSLPEASETSPRRKNSRSSSEMLPPPSPLDSIKEDEEIEEEDLNKSPSLVAPAHLVDQSVAAEPTPPLTPKNDVHATRQDRADSLVTVTGEDTPKDVKDQASDTDSSKSQLDEPIELPELRPSSLRPASMRPPSLAPPVGNRDISRPGTSHSAKITPNKQSSSFMINFWNSLFGSWLAPVVRWFSRVCGGRKRAT